MISLSFVQQKNALAIAEAFKKAASSGARDFKGVLNESHRAFVVSGDLLHEKGADPWLNSSDPPQYLSELLSYLTSHRGPTDVLLAFDGCNRACRRQMEDHVMKLPASAELFLVYENMPCSWCARKHPFSSRNTEVGYIALPASRGKICVRSRPEGSAGSAAGEDTSYFTSYTGIPMPHRNKLPLMNPEEKQKIFKDEVNPLPSKWQKRGFGGVPLYWCETKSVAAWSQVLEDTMSQAVVDLSPGSGALAEACMKRGAQYFGVVFDKTHFQWLSNVVDRASLKYICAQGGVLYQADLATHVKELFSDNIAGDDDDEDDLSDEDDAGTQQA